MSSGTVNKEVDIKETQKDKEIQESAYNPITKLFSKFYKRSFLTTETYYDVSNLVISFLNLPKKSTQLDLYQNGTKVSFRNIDPEFQRILKQEFADAMRDFSRYFK